MTASPRKIANNLRDLMEREGWEADADPRVIVCQGPPTCLLEGDGAVAAQEAGCAWCRKIVVHGDGTETVEEPTRA